MQIDFIIMSKKLKSTLKNCRTYNSAEIGSDHSLFIANLVMKKPKKITKKLLKRYNTDKLQSKETSKKFASIIGEGVANLLDDQMNFTLNSKKSYIQQLKKKSDINDITKSAISQAR